MQLKILFELFEYQLDIPTIFINESYLFGGDPKVICDELVSATFFVTVCDFALSTGSILIIFLVFKMYMFNLYDTRWLIG